MANRVSFLNSIEQKRAKKASNFVNQISDNEIKEFRSAVSKFPSMIINCGLLQALTFYKSKEHLNKAYQALKEWFGEKYGWQEGQFLNNIINLDMSEYRQKTKEAIAFLTWLKRFADVKYEQMKLKTDKGEKSA